jgi:hypothetical protein
MGALRTVGAVAPGPVTPARSDEAAWQGGSGVAVENGENLNSASPTAGVQGKAFATLQAQLALAGFQLTKDGHGGFVVASWGRHRDLDSLTAVEAFARQVGAVR